MRIRLICVFLIMRHAFGACGVAAIRRHGRHVLCSLQPYISCSMKSYVFYFAHLFLPHFFISPYLLLDFFLYEPPP